jgi:hypothetical protein
VLALLWRMKFPTSIFITKLASKLGENLTICQNNSENYDEIKMEICGEFLQPSFLVLYAKCRTNLARGDKKAFDNLPLILMAS